jgi:hypothetical protein
MRAKTAAIADIAQKAAGHAVFANVNHARKGVLDRAVNGSTSRVLAQKRTGGKELK